MSNLRNSASLRQMHDDGVCPEACVHCARIEAYVPPEPREGNYFMTVQDYPEPS